jgi:hypothetical protein
MVWKRDLVREDLFNSSYEVKPEVWIKYELNPDKTFKVFELKFKYKDKEWDLVEVYKDTTNMTDYCTLTGIEEKFDKFYKAEFKLVDLMKEVDGGNSY